MKVITPQLRWTLFGLLCVAGIFNAMDRPIIAILKPDTSVKDANDSVSFTMLVLLAAVVSAVLLVIYLFTDRTRIKSLPEKLELPTKPASES